MRSDKFSQYKLVYSTDGAEIEAIVNKLCQYEGWEVHSVQATALSGGVVAHSVFLKKTIRREIS